MAWPFKKPEENQPPNEQNKSDIDALVERMNASFQQTVKPLSDAVTAMQKKWTDLEEAAVAPEPPNKETPADFNTDPEAWKRQVLGPLAQQTIIANARLTERDILDGIHQRWSHIIPKVKEEFSKLPIQQKAQANYAQVCQNVVNIEIGKEAQTAGLRFDGESKRFFLEDASPANNGEPTIYDDPGLTWQDPRSGKILSPAAQLAKLDIKPEDFAKSVKEGVV